MRIPLLSTNPGSDDPDRLPPYHRGYTPRSLAQQLHPAAHAEFRQQRRDVELYGALGKIQRSGDMSPHSSVGGIKLAPGCVAGVATWVCWLNLVIYRSALHTAAPPPF
jgi:hypothetical protein